MFIQPALAQTQQIFVNKFWNVLNANPASGVDWSASILDPFGNLITAGNTVDANYDVNLLLVKQSPTGQVLWQQEFSAGTDTKNYGIALTSDNSGNIYVTGASYLPTNQNHDYLILKYNSSGTLQWSHLQNGTDNGEDIPSDIAIDASGNVYVTGGSYGNSTDYDYLTIRLDASGNFNWKQRYDYANLMDGAGALTVRGGYVRVTGASASSVTDWDYANLRYSVGSGALVSAIRAGANGTGLDTPTAMAITSDDDMVVTGYGGTGATNDCYTVMLDEDFNLLWEAWYDGDGMDDRAFDVEVDSFDNIYICGTTQKANGGSDYLLLKYDNTGTEMWSKKRSARDDTRASKALFLELDEVRDHIIVTGDEAADNSNSYLKTIRYDENGKILWESIHDGNSTALEKATGLITDSDGVVNVTGVIQLSPTDQEYEVITYKPCFYDMEFDYDAEGVAVNVGEEIIIRFAPDVLDTTFIDDQGLFFGTVSEVVIDTNVINILDQKLNANGRLKNWKLRKIFDFLDRNKTSITSRFGNKVNLPSVWSALILELEEGMDVELSSDSINTIDSKYTWYAHPNYTFSLDTEFYNDQGNLHGNNNTIFQDAHINMEDAWDYGYLGIPEIKIGVFDTGIKFDHSDFTEGGSFGGLAESIVDSGVNFTNFPHEPFDDNSTDNDPYWGHGTKVAGIIAALRNNDEGIQGIAGGDISNGSEGAHLIAFKVMDGNSPSVQPTIVGSDPCRGLMYALTEGDNDEPMIQIGNYSFGKPFEDNEDGLLVLKEIFYTAYKAGVIHVASRGNEGNDIQHHPGTYDDEWELTVGSSGTDGRHKTEDNSFFINPPDDDPVAHDAWRASFGKNIDLISPGTSAIIYTTHNGENNFQDDACYDRYESEFDYGCFNGASAATPHVSGLSALLLEMHEAKYDSKLAVEDIEHLIEYGAKDVADLFNNPPYGESYDEFNGWGLLDAGGALDLISETQKVVHLTIEPTSIVNICDDPEFCFSRFTTEYESPITGTVFPSEPVNISNAAHVFEYSANLNIDICTEYSATFVDFPDENKEPVWTRNSMSNLWGTPTPDVDNVFFLFTPKDDIDIEIVSLNGCELNLNMTGYTTKVFQIDTEVLNPPETVPAIDPSENYVFNISFLVDDPDNNFIDDVIITDTEEIPIKSAFNLYPNPASEQLYIYGRQNNINSAAPVTIEVFDVNGVLIQTQSFDLNSSSAFEGTISLDAYPSGIYFCRMRNEHQYITQRFVKI